MGKHLEEALVGREEREANYRQWSERAVIVGFNSEKEAYDIIVTTESATGADKRSLNKTIRQVRATLPAKTQQFSPGDAVTIGYVNEKREHPIILGGGDNAVQNPVPITLGESLPEEVFTATPMTVACLTNGTENPDCEIDCGASEPEIQLQVTGGAGPFTWEATKGDLEITNGTRLALVTPPAGGTFEAGVAYKTPNCVSSTNPLCFSPGAPCFNAVCNNFVRFYGCDDAFISTATCGGCCGFLGLVTGDALCDAICSTASEPRCDDETFDFRSIAGITCNPCGISMVGAVVTVTDSTEQKVSKTVTVINNL